MEQVARTFDLLSKLEQNFPEKEDYLCKKRSGQWIKYSVKEYVKNTSRGKPCSVWAHTSSEY